MKSQSRWTRTTRAASQQVLREYSTSFSLAARILPRAVRDHIAAVYAVVRVADEVVDGAFPEATGAQKRDALLEHEAALARAVECGFSTDPYLHAFALTARATGIGPEHWGPFYAAMRQDADPVPHDRESLRTYIHGSAEVVGEMCVLAFFDGAPLPSDAGLHDRLFRGARALGSAFQKVNFLRDLGEDTTQLHRSYFPEAGAATGADPAGPASDPDAFDDAVKDSLVAEIDAELRLASAAIDLLPPRTRPAVRAAQSLFTDLNARLARTPARELLRTRVRVPDPRKLYLTGRALAGRNPFPAR
ncbi:phytoene/squalene synthase family protein [Brevibacterium litoralis]|uniref:phytoene/squalene synthase family protein n=1 Tax=Brevibacterium litoralis TaxID=3138935 RepID=UPI0032EC4570